MTMGSRHGKDELFRTGSRPFLRKAYGARRPGPIPWAGAGAWPRGWRFHKSLPQPGAGVYGGFDGD